MSGIFGIIHTQGAPVEKAWLKSMRESMIHRGPDGSGIYHQGSVGIGHLLLQVTPESKYEQSPCFIAGLVVSADARLDAREELMDKLGVPHETRQHITDSELIGLGYKKWGEKCVEYFLGDFAFAIWDEVGKKLFCARDHVGVKQFFYAFQNGLFIFSTELRTIVQSNLIPTTLDYLRLRDSVLDLDEEPEATCWTNIRRLLGARAMVLKDATIKLKTYWDLKHHETLRYNNPEEYGLKLRSLLEQSIADRMRTQYEIGVPLSGGFDSSTIACIAARIMKQEGRILFTTSSVLSSDKKKTGTTDETEYIQAVLEQESNIEASFVYSNSHSYLLNVEKKFNLHYAPINLWHDVDDAIFKEQGHKNVRRVLSGYLGDCTVSNSSIYPLPFLLPRLRWRTCLKLLLLLKKNTKQSTLSIIKKEIVLPSISFRIYKLWFRLKKKAMPWDLTNLPLPIDDYELKALNQRVEKKYQKEGYFTNPRVYKNIWDIDQNWMNEEWDCSAAHQKLEVCYPLLDKRVIEFLYQLPPEVFHINGFKRGLIRLAMRDVLPNKILWRQNKGYYSPGFQFNLRGELAVFLHQIKQNRALLEGHKRLLDVEKAIKILSNLEKSLRNNTFDQYFWSSTPVLLWVSFLTWGEKLRSKTIKHEK